MCSSDLRTIAITIGEPIPNERGQDADEVTEVLRARLAELLDETIERYPGKESGAWWLPARWGGTAPTPDEALLIEERVRREKAERRKR